MAFERPVTRKMKEAAEAERRARLEAEYAAAIERQKAEQQAKVEKAKVDWEVLIKALPEELNKIEQVILNDIIPEWEQRANAPIDWEKLDEPICSAAWELHFNKYERDEYSIPYYYESSDGMRAGVDTEWAVREKMPGSYWTSPKDPTRKEWFISRASAPDAPIPAVQYPYCTIAGELDLWKEYPHDKARVDAIVKKMEEDRTYYQALLEEARTALAGTAQERAKYLLNQREADRVRNELKKVWDILNLGKPQTKFWGDILQAL
jgi:hypothetical protein